MPFLDVKGRKIYYEEHGQGEPLLLVPGLAMDILGWRLQLPAFAEKFRTIVLDNRDVGQSDYVTEPYEVSDMANDAIELADHLDLESFHLLGVSMGGAIAQEMALAHPARVRSLTLVVTWAEGGRYAQFKSKVWGREMSRLSLEEEVDNLMLLILSEQFFENQEMVDFVRGVMLSNPHPQKPEGFVRQLDAAGRHNTIDRLPNLPMPAHVIGAEQDVLVPVWKSVQIAEAIPGCKYSEIKGGAHGAQLERADEFNAMVLEFLAEHSSAATAV